MDTFFKYFLEALDRCSAVDVSLCFASAAGLLLNITALSIVLNHIFKVETTRLYYRVFTIANMAALVAESVWHMSRKHYSEEKYCYLVGFVTNLVGTLAISTSVIVAFDLFLEMSKTKIRFFQTKCYALTAYSMIVSLATAFNLPRLWLNKWRPRESSSTRTPKIVEPSHNTSLEFNRLIIIEYDCQGYTRSQLVLIDVFDIVGKLVVPFLLIFSTMASISFKLKSRGITRNSENHLPRKKGIRLIKCLLGISALRFLLVSGLLVTRLLRHIYYVSQSSTGSNQSSSWLICLLQRLEILALFFYMVVYVSPFLFHFILNAKFRLHLFRILKLGSSSSVPNAADILLERQQ